MKESSSASAKFSAAELRAELGLTLAEMGERCGGVSKATIHALEQTGAASPAVALAIEKLSIRDGVPRIDAGELNETVRLARENVAEAAE